MKTTKGFTLVELVIVIIIVGILSIVAVPIYKGYVERAYMTEAKALLGTVNTAQKVYFAEYRGYADSNVASKLDVDASSNKYFTAFTIDSVAPDGFQASTTGIDSASGMTLTIKVSSAVADRGSKFFINGVEE